MANLRQTLSYVAVVGCLWFAAGAANEASACPVLVPDYSWTAGMGGWRFGVEQYYGQISCVCLGPIEFGVPVPGYLLLGALEIVPVGFLTAALTKGRSFAL